MCGGNLENAYIRVWDNDCGDSSLHHKPPNRNENALSHESVKTQLTIEGHSPRARRQMHCNAGHKGPCLLPALEHSGYRNPDDG